MAKARNAERDTRVTSTLSPKAPRIMVAEPNSSVEWHVSAAGGLPIKPSWTVTEAVRDLASCDGLIVTGGGDVNPALYGEDRDRRCYGITATRDLRELALIGAARRLGIPVLGICRGMQLLNVEAGGTLHQHLPDKVKHDNHGYSMMPVRTVKGSLVAKTLGANPMMLHLHHQAVKRTAKGFTVTARHADGTVEAIESFDGRVVGVQFHPESHVSSCKEDAVGYRLFTAYVAACQRYRRRAKAKGRITIQDPTVFTAAWPVAVEAYERGSRPYVWQEPTKPAATPPARKSGRKVAESPVGYCSPCGIAFDKLKDLEDHDDFFHPAAISVPRRRNR